MPRQNRGRERWAARLILAGVGGLSLGAAPAAALVTCSPASCTPACDSSCTYYTCATNNTGTFDVKTLPVTIPSQPTACSEPDAGTTYQTLPFTHKATQYKTIPATALSYDYTTCTANIQPGAPCVTCPGGGCQTGENCATCPADCGACPTWKCSVDHPAGSCTTNSADLAGYDLQVNTGTCLGPIDRGVKGCGNYTGPKDPPTAVFYCSHSNPANVPGCGASTWAYWYTPIVTCTKNQTCP